MLTGNAWEHLWYLYMLLGIYLILPILHTYVHVLSYPCVKNVNQMLIFALLTFFFTSLLPSMKWSLGINFPLSSVYVGYLLIGYLLSTESIKNKLARVCDAVYITIIVMTFFIIIIGNYVEHILGMESFFDYASYHSIVIVIQSSLLFYLFTKRKGAFDKFCSLYLIQRFNRCSLGIYIVHMVWINIFIKMLNINIMQYNSMVILPVGIFIFLLSWITTEILLKFPLMKKLL